jgi:hypothetical protein
MCSAFLLAVLIFPCDLAFAQGLSPTEMQAARKIYIAKCAKCHEFYDPAAYGQVEWDTWMLKMKKKSKLKPDQFDLLSRYLNKVRAEKQAAANRE